MRSALKKMPKGLNATFEETLKRIKRQPESRTNLGMRTLMWISHARRPILVEELRQALAVSPGDTSLNQDSCPLPKHMVACCLGLVTIDEESSTIRLVHFSVQEYFRRQRMKLFPLGEQSITKTCLIYLSFDVFSQGYCASDKDFEARLQHYPFLNYAARYWGYHEQECSGKEIEKLAIMFLEHDLNLACSMQVVNTPSFHYDGYSQNFANLSALHVAASLGWDALVRLLLEKGDLDPDSEEYGRTPLSWAAESGHEAVVRLLLENGGVDPDHKNECGETPLWFAARNGHEAIVRLLLENGGVDPEPKDEDGRTALWRAAQNGHEAVVRLLLEKGGVEPDFDAAIEAATNGHRAVVRLLTPITIMIGNQAY
jgi:hypothetical protein